MQRRERSLVVSPLGRQLHREPVQPGRGRHDEPPGPPDGRRRPGLHVPHRRLQEPHCGNPARDGIPSGRRHDAGQERRGQRSRPGHGRYRRRRQQPPGARHLHDDGRNGDLFTRALGRARRRLDVGRHLHHAERPRLRPPRPARRRVLHPARRLPAHAHVERRRGLELRLRRAPLRRHPPAPGPDDLEARHDHRDGRRPLHHRHRHSEPPHFRARGWRRHAPQGRRRTPPAHGRQALQGRGEGGRGRAGGARPPRRPRRLHGRAEPPRLHGGLPRRHAFRRRRGDVLERLDGNALLPEAGFG